ncbi:MAG: hypothetical protein V3U89_01345 [Methylophilaceae bacterium]
MKTIASMKVMKTSTKAIDRLGRVKAFFLVLSALSVLILLNEKIRFALLN